MGPRGDRQAVVDPQTLAVHGVGGLHVLDASVLPSPTSGNLNGCMAMVAEKGAALLLEQVHAGTVP